jgi:anti-anti-sigma factor
MLGLAVSQDGRGDTAEVRVRGDIDIATVPQLGLELARVGGNRFVIVDLAAVTFLDVSAVRLLLSFAVRARRDGFDYRIIPPPPLVSRIFDLTQTRARLNLVT